MFICKIVVFSIENSSQPFHVQSKQMILLLGLLLVWTVHKVQWNSGLYQIILLLITGSLQIFLTTSELGMNTNGEFTEFKICDWFCFDKI